MTDNFRNKIIQGCGQLQISIDEERIEKLFSYYNMVVEKNKVMNLTSITEENEFIVKHILDSLSLVKSIDPETIAPSDRQLSMIDIGTGAGFPGMVLKIVFPAMKITLFDSLRKRLLFLDEVIAELKLSDISTLHGRAEDYGQNPAYREKYDVAVSRAVANMAALSEYCLPFVRKNGCFVAYKASGSEEEIKSAEKAVRLLGGSIEDTVEFVLPESDIERTLVRIRKTRSTPSKYPRKAGVPAKEPLGIQ